MYVCLCKGVNCSKIKQCIADNEVTTFKELRELLEVGTQCGKCAFNCRQMIKESLCEKIQNNNNYRQAS